MSEPLRDSGRRTLPLGWEWAVVGDLAASIDYGHTASSKDTPEGPRFLRITDITPDGVDWSTVPGCEIAPPDIERCRLGRGDLLFARIGATVGKSFLIRQCPEAVFASYLIRVRVKAPLEASYIFAFFQSSEYWQQITEVQQGIGRPVVNGTKLATMFVPIPPAREQSRIADRLDELLPDLSAGVAALERVKKKLKRYRSAVLHAAVTGRLTADWRKTHGPPAEPADKLLARILIERRRRWEERTLAKYARDNRTPPKSWKNRYVESVAPKLQSLPELPESWFWASADALLWDCSYGTSVRCEYGAKGIPVLRIPNIAKGELDLGDIKFATESLGIYDDTEYLATNDLLVCRTNGSVRLIGKAALVRESPSVHTFFASYLIRLRIVDPRIASLTHLLFESPLGRRFIEANAASSAGQHNVSMTTLQQMPIPLPPLAEQSAIVEAVNEKLSQIDAMEAEVERGLARAARLRQAILKAAFEGKLVPQDPTDEPASVLLERIKRERAGRAHAPKSARKRQRVAVTGGPNAAVGA